MLMEAKHRLDHVLPVIDLKRGQVVQAIAGNREQYAALRSRIVDSIHPGRVAKAMCEQVASQDIYVADLDAIDGQAPDFNGCTAIENSGAEVWLDAGTGTTDSVRRLLSRLPKLRRVVVGLESLPSLRDLETLLAAIGPERFVFSLDLRNGLPITKDRTGQRMSAESIAAYAIEEGISSIIVLDLATVGSQGGGDETIDLCRNIRSRHLDVEIISGGGVRHADDVRRFVEAGCNRVLVSSALHAGAFGDRPDAG